MKLLYLFAFVNAVHGRANIRVDEGSNNLVVSAGDNKVEVHAAAGMSIGAISNVEEAIDRTAAETKLHAASISSVRTEINASNANIKTAQSDISALQQTVVDLLAAAKASDEELRTTKESLDAAVQILSKTAKELATAQTQVADLETELAGSCGSACKSGEFITSPCTDDNKHVCAECADGTFSFGGFPHTCTPHATCPVGSHIKSAGSPVANVVCETCEEGKTFSLKENAAECTKCTAECDETYVVDTKCTTTADLKCKVGFWSNMEDTIHVESSTDPFWYKLDAENKATWQIEKNAFIGGGRGGHLSEGFSYTWQIGTAFDPKTGTFTAPNDGYYMISMAARLDGAHRNWVEIVADINNARKSGKSEQGTIFGTSSNMPEFYGTLRAAGTTFLKEGDTVAMLLHFGNDMGNFRINGGQTSFGIAQVKVPSGADQGFLGVPAPNDMDCCSWKIFQRPIYTDKDKILAFAKGADVDNIYNLGGLNQNNGVYTAPEDGIYKCNGNFFFRHTGSSFGRYVRFGIIYDGIDHPDTIDNSGCALMEGDQQRSETISIGCFASLKAGQTAEISYAQADSNPWSVDPKSSFSCVRLGPRTLPGFLGDLTSPGLNHGNQWFKLTDFTGLERPQQNWVTWEFNNDGQGGTSFDGTDFTAPVDGIYSVEAAVRFDSAGGSANNEYSRLVVAVNGEPDETMNGHGIAEIRSNAPNTFFSMTISGFLKMKKGDKAALWVLATMGSVHHSSDSSGWSMALVHALA